MKNCKKCGAELEKKQNVCPACGKKQKGKGKFIVIAIVVIIIIAFVALLFSDPVPDEPDEVVYIGEEDIPKLYTNANDYVGKYVKITGQIFNIDEYDYGYYFQMNEDIENYENNTLVRFETDSDIKLDYDQYVMVDGYVAGAETYTSIAGLSITAPEIIAKDVQVISFIDAVYPTISTLEVGETIDKKGYKLTIDKVEFAEKETRIYYTFENGGKTTFSLYDYSVVATQGSNQLSMADRYFEDGYEGTEDDLKTGTISSGMLSFEGIDHENEFKVYFEGSDDNWDSYEFVFTITP